MWTRANLDDLARLLFRQGRSRKEVANAVHEMAAMQPHRHTSSYVDGVAYDVGSWRTWTNCRRRAGSSPRHGKRCRSVEKRTRGQDAGFSSYDLLMDWMAEGKGPVEIAYLMRRDVEDVFAAMAICRWLIKEVNHGTRQSTVTDRSGMGCRLHGMSGARNESMDMCYT